MHRHKKLAAESGVEFMAPISGACVRGLRIGLPVYLEHSNAKWKIMRVKHGYDSMKRRFNKMRSKPNPAHIGLYNMSTTQTYIKLKYDA